MPSYGDPEIERFKFSAGPGVFECFKIALSQRKRQVIHEEVKDPVWKFCLEQLGEDVDFDLSSISFFEVRRGKTVYQPQHTKRRFFVCTQGKVEIGIKTFDSSNGSGQIILNRREIFSVCADVGFQIEGIDEMSSFVLLQESREEKENPSDLWKKLKRGKFLYQIFLPSHSQEKNVWFIEVYEGENLIREVFLSLDHEPIVGPDEIDKRRLYDKLDELDEELQEY